MSVQYYTTTDNSTPTGIQKQFRAATGLFYSEYTDLSTLEQNVISLIDADISSLGIDIVFPLMQTCFAVSLQLPGFKSAGISTFGGNPPRYKLGSINHNFGNLQTEYEQINYPSFTTRNHQCTYLYGQPIADITLAPPGIGNIVADTLYGLGIFSIKDTAFQEITPLSALTSATGFSIYLEEPQALNLEISYFAFTVITDQDPSSIVQSYYN